MEIGVRLPVAPEVGNREGPLKLREHAALSAAIVEGREVALKVCRDSPQLREMRNLLQRTKRAWQVFSALCQQLISEGRSEVFAIVWADIAAREALHSSIMGGGGLERLEEIARSFSAETRKQEADRFVSKIGHVSAKISGQISEELKSNLEHFAKRLFDFSEQPDFAKAVRRVQSHERLLLGRLRSLEKAIRVLEAAIDHFADKAELPELKRSLLPGLRNAQLALDEVCKAKLPLKFMSGTELCIGLHASYKPQFEDFFRATDTANVILDKPGAVRLLDRMFHELSKGIEDYRAEFFASAEGKMIEWWFRECEQSRAEADGIAITEAAMARLEVLREILKSSNAGAIQDSFDKLRKQELISEEDAPKMSTLLQSLFPPNPLPEAVASEEIVQAQATAPLSRVRASALEASLVRQILSKWSIADEFEPGVISLDAIRQITPLKTLLGEESFISLLQSNPALLLLDGDSFALYLKDLSRYFLAYFRIHKCVPDDLEHLAKASSRTGLQELSQELAERFRARQEKGEKGINVLSRDDVIRAIREDPEMRGVNPEFALELVLRGFYHAGSFFRGGRTVSREFVQKKLQNLHNDDPDQIDTMLTLAIRHFMVTTSGGYALTIHPDRITNASLKLLYTFAMREKGQQSE